MLVITHTLRTLLVLLCFTPILPASLPGRRYSGDHISHNPLEVVNVQTTKVALDDGIQLSLNSTVLEAGNSYQWYELSWKGVLDPSTTDWIGLVVPAGADVSQTAPAKYRQASTDPKHLSTGKGKLKFRLINYRAPMQFAFLRGGFEQPVLSALSPVIEVENPNEPLQRHLALTGNNTQMLIQWVTKNSSQPVVKWGTKSEKLKHVAIATSSTYNRSSLCGPPASTIGFTDPGMFHSALVEGLKPGRRYYYTVGDESWGFSPESSFTAAPPVGPDTSVKILAVADMGQAEVDGSTRLPHIQMSLNTTAGLLRDVRDEDYQLLVHNGDISYAYGYVTQWDNFMHQIEPIVSTVPYMTSPGNHERNWPESGDRYNRTDSGGECGVPFERRIRMPLSGVDKPWYSFDFGPVHFLQYSTEHDFSKGSEQHSWVLEDLVSVNSTLTPWIIVGGHRPFYISSDNNNPGSGDQPVASDLREAFESMFLEQKVDLTLHGHHHSYQRTCPTVNYTCQDTSSQAQPRKSSRRIGSDRTEYKQQGSTILIDAADSAPVHLVIGNAGYELSRNIEPQPQEIWQVVRLSYGYLRIKANRTELTTEMVSSALGNVMDSVTLKKPRNWGRIRMRAKQSRSKR